MFRLTAIGLILSGLAGPAVAACATAGLDVRCIRVGPPEELNTQGQATPQVSTIVSETATRQRERIDQQREDARPERTARANIRRIETGLETRLETGRADISARFVTAPDRSGSPRLTTRGRQVVARQPAPKPARPILEPGAVVPPEGLILMNPSRYGLPLPQDGWTYFSLGRAIYRADLRTREVLTYVNPHINRY
ncbi:hypothetical protein [Pseudooceanicola sp.]|uniref:hypothetical protein n=1 Tax=Pseudooceanicola sp. TaxID=1914328 RepID=UPI004059FA6B